MSENSKPTHVREIKTEGCTYEVRAVFGEKIKLAQLLAARVLRDLDRKSLDTQGELTCNPADSEV